MKGIKARPLSIAKSAKIDLNSVVYSLPILGGNSMPAKTIGMFGFLSRTASIIACRLPRVSESGTPRSPSFAPSSKRKTSTSKKRMRRSHHKLSSVNVVEDKKSGEYKLSHHIDLKTGFYNGKKILDI